MKFKIFQPQAIHERGSRPNQEDSIFPALNTATVNDRLFILCDGMGGHESGEVASGTVCETMSSFINNNLGPDQVLDDALVEQAVDAAYAAVNAKDTAGMKKMGTTLTFLCLHKGGCTVAHIGDSRIYHLRPSTNEVLYRSRDHSHSSRHKRYRPADGYHGQKDFYQPVRSLVLLNNFQQELYSPLHQQLF